MAWEINKETGVLELVTEEHNQKQPDENSPGVGGVDDGQQGQAMNLNNILSFTAGLSATIKGNSPKAQSKVTCKDNKTAENISVEKRNGIDCLVHQSGFSVPRNWPEKNIEATENGFKIVNKNNPKDFVTLSEGKIDLSDSQTAFSTDIHDKTGATAFAMTKNNNGEISYATADKLPKGFKLEVVVVGYKTYSPNDKGELVHKGADGKEVALAAIKHASLNPKGEEIGLRLVDKPIGGEKSQNAPDSHDNENKQHNTKDNNIPDKLKDEAKKAGSFTHGATTNVDTNENKTPSTTVTGQQPSAVAASKVS